jgi:tRNA(Ile2) C34 agmatinyltransferase TiaS
LTDVGIKYIKCVKNVIHGIKEQIKKGNKMRIKEITSQYRRDFTAIYECENCGKTEKGEGYDDFNFHHNVLPKRKCKECGKQSPEDNIPRQTKYPEGLTV